MHATFDQLVGVIRVHADGAALGDAYTWACTATLDGTTCKLHGATRSPTASEARAVKRLLRGLGVAVIAWERRNVPLPRQTAIRTKR